MKETSVLLIQDGLNKVWPKTDEIILDQEREREKERKSDHW